MQYRNGRINSSRNIVNSSFKSFIKVNFYLFIYLYLFGFREFTHEARRVDKTTRMLSPTHGAFP